jgi:hypothetical protein
VSDIWRAILVALATPSDVESESESDLTGAFDSDPDVENESESNLE